MKACRICGIADARPTFPDPCCGAPDCENLTDVVHYLCASPYVQREIDTNAEFEKAVDDWIAEYDD